MRRAGWCGVVGAVLVLAVAGAWPIDGAAGVERLPVTCGPAAGAITGQTGPGTGGRPDPVVRHGSDTGESASVWCATEARTWLGPRVVLALGLLLAGAAALVVTSRRSRHLADLV